MNTKNLGSDSELITDNEIEFDTDNYMNGSPRYQEIDLYQANSHDFASSVVFTVGRKYIIKEWIKRR